MPKVTGNWLLGLLLSACQCRGRRRPKFDPWVGKIPWWRKWQPPPVFSPGESHGQRSLAGHSPRGRTESDTSQQLNSSWLLLHSHSVSQGSSARHPPSGAAEGRGSRERLSVRELLPRALSGHRRQRRKGEGLGPWFDTVRRGKGWSLGLQPGALSADPIPPTHPSPSSRSCMCP